MQEIDDEPDFFQVSALEKKTRGERHEIWDKISQIEEDMGGYEVRLDLR